MDCPEPPTNPPDPTPNVPWPFSPLRRSYLWDWESHYDDTEDEPSMEED